jgi:Tol biopolymer transport system component
MSGRHRSPWFLTAILLSGCKVNTTIPNGVLSCTTSNECPRPYQCSMQRCSLPGGADGANAGDASEDGPGKDAAIAPDAVLPDAATACNLSRPFGASVLVSGLNRDVGLDQGARLTPDEFVVYFHSNRSGNLDIWRSSRSTLMETFSEPKPVAEVNTLDGESWPSLSGDGRTLYFESNRLHNGNAAIFVALRKTTLAVFDPPSLVANLGMVNTNGQPAILPGGDTILFASNREASWELFGAKIGTDGQFKESMKLSTVNTPARDLTPVPAADDLTLYFSSTRADGGAKGEEDIWMARRASREANYDPPMNVSELNTAAAEFPTWASPDGCRLYFYRVDPNGSKIYVAERMR